MHYVSKTFAVKDSLRLDWSQRNKSIHYILLGVGLGMILISFFSFKPQHYFVLLILGGIACIYSFPIIPFGKKRRIKEYGILKILTLTLLWTLVTVWLPANTQHFDTPLFWFVFVKRFVFMLALCLLFDVRDREIDEEKGIRTFPVILGKKGSYVMAYLLLIMLTILSILQYFYWPQLGFLIAMLTSVAATFITIEATKKSNSDIIYLAGIDGMMLLQSLLIFLFSLKL